MNCGRCGARLEDRGYYAYVCRSCSWFSLDTTTRQEIAEQVARGGGSQPTEVIAEIEISAWLYVKDREVRQSFRDVVLPLAGMPDEPSKARRLLREIGTELSMHRPTMPDWLSDQVEKTRTEVDALETLLAETADDNAFLEQKRRPAWSRKKSRPHDSVKYQLALDVAATLLADNIVITKQMADPFGQILILVLMAVGEPSEDPSRLVRRIADVVQRPHLNRYRGCEGHRLHDDSRDRDDLVVAVRADGPRFVPCWALEPGDLKIRLADPQILLVVRVPPQSPTA